MQQTTSYPSFISVHHMLNNIKANTDAAEMHGILCGFICAGKYMDGKSWFDIFVGKQNVKMTKDKASRELLLQLYHVSSQKLQSIDFDFQLFLPDDDELLHERALALANWCRGFIMGLEWAGINAHWGLSEDSRDALAHMVEVSKLDFEHIEVCEEDEMAFIEVAEYVRMAAIMIYSEVAHQQSIHANDITH